jgi:predicted dehydrogenase
VIGAGSIGALKQKGYDNKKSDNILTHAHAYYKHPKIDLVGIIDVDIDKARKAANKWGCQYSNTIEYFKNEQLDIISVCVSTKYHYKILKNIIKYNPKIIVAEKPFCSNLKESKSIARLYKKNNINLIVNYSRRFLSEIQSKVDFIRKDLNLFSTGIFHYCRGLKHEGCHALDICLWLLGDFKKLYTNPYFKIIDRSLDDPTLRFNAKFGQTDVFFRGTNGNDYKLFEFELFTKNYIIKFKDFFQTIEIYKKEKDKIWGDFYIIDKNPEIIKTDIKKSLYLMIDNVVNFLNGKYSFDEDILNGRNAIKVHKILEGIN